MISARKISIPKPGDYKQLKFQNFEPATNLDDTEVLIEVKYAGIN